MRYASNVLKINRCAPSEVSFNYGYNYLINYSEKKMLSQIRQISKKKNVKGKLRENKSLSERKQLRACTQRKVGKSLLD